MARLLQKFWTLRTLTGLGGNDRNAAKGQGGTLDDPDLKPFWESAHRNGSILFIHPMFDSGDERVNDFGMNNAIGRITDTLIAISRIIYSGHVETYHNAKIVIGIGVSIAICDWPDDAQL